MLRVFARCLLTSAILLQTVLAVNAATIDSVEVWAQKFQDAAYATDVDAMKDLIDSAADQQMKANTLVDNVEPLLAGKHVLYAEQFNNQSLGTFFKRVNIAVMYKETAIFYAFEFVRGDGGWRILGIAADGNVNNILARKWPP